VILLLPLSAIAVCVYTRSLREQTVRDFGNCNAMLVSDDTRLLLFVACVCNRESGETEGCLYLPLFLHRHTSNLDAKENISHAHTRECTPLADRTLRQEEEAVVVAAHSSVAMAASSASTTNR
jgi:hypothetical protein